MTQLPLMVDRPVPVETLSFQDLILHILDRSSVGNKEGEILAAFFRNHRDLWTTVWFGPSDESGVGRMLRDLTTYSRGLMGGIYHADRVYVRVPRDTAEDFLLAVSEVSPDELDRVPGSERTYVGDRVYRLWFD